MSGAGWAKLYLKQADLVQTVSSADLLDEPPSANGAHGRPRQDGWRRFETCPAVCKRAGGCLLLRIG
jgi:hypothetical protein